MKLGLLLDLQEWYGIVEAANNVSQKSKSKVRDSLTRSFLDAKAYLEEHFVTPLVLDPQGDGIV